MYVKRELRSFFFAAIGPYAWLALLGIILTLPVGLFDAAIASFLRPCIDSAVGGRGLAFASSLPAIIVGFSSFQGICIYSSSCVNALVGNRISLDVKKKLIGRLLAQDASYFDGTDSGHVLLRFSKDAETACEGLVAHLRFFLTRMVSAISLVAVMFFNSWWLALIALAFVAAAFYPLRFMRKKMRNLTGRRQLSGASETVFCNECFSGSRTIAAYNLQRQMRKRHEAIAEEMFRVSMRMARHSSWPSPVMHVVISFGIAGIFILGGYLVPSGLMGSGSFVAFVAAMLLLYTPIKGIGENIAGIHSALLAAERVTEALSIEPKVPAPASREAKALQFKGQITVENVRFSYGGERSVLRGLSLTIGKGEKVGIVGRSGCGKTTITNLLLRLYDVSDGRIAIDGTDIRQIPIGDLRQSIAIVFQDNYLFSGTIRQNILLGKPYASDDELRAAVDAALLGEFVDSLPCGLDTEVGERGSLLSGGQRQRVAIGRAILKGAPIVILDEATSALDTSSEEMVQRALNNLMRERTVIIIAHRLSTLSDADRVVVIDGGRAIESGSHGELVALPNGLYAAFHARQNVTKPFSRGTS
ncbi:MAG: ABC transporter ATP-binding protein/permease [Puniceicoccales bacterium]|jgi:subfamily B ATP-binding cassette protein MsbA|nr:ABC transporter ATP-binding protein/permease [Puniceicoccales bacterium]